MGGFWRVMYDIPMSAIHSTDTITYFEKSQYSNLKIECAQNRNYEKHTNKRGNSH